MVQTKQDVLAAIAERHTQIGALGAKRLGLFGSFVNGRPHKDSDVDLLVEFQPGQKTFDNFIQLAFLLEAAFRPHVELVTPESLSPYIGPHISDEVECHSRRLSICSTFWTK